MNKSRRRVHFIWSVLIVFLIQLPLLLFNAPSLGGFVAQIGLFLLIALAVGGLYVGLVNIMHADRQAPIPWYASPIVWLGVPLLLVIFYVLIP